MSYKERFHELLNDEYSFYNFKKRYTIRYWGQGYYGRALFDNDNPDTIDNMGPGELICRLSDENYDFTQDEFNKFITCATYAGCNSWLVGCGIHCDNNENNDEEWANEEFDIRAAAITIMFSKFKPNDDQLDTMMRCHQYNPFTWVTILNKSGYELSWLNKDYLKKFGYLQIEQEEIPCEYDSDDLIASTK